MSEPPAGRTIVVWVIDDARDNHDLVERSLPDGWRAAAHFHAFLAPENALALARSALADGEDALLPDVVFMDFFLGTMHGDEATRALLELYREHDREGDRPVIVGHSSMPGASDAIVRVGADLAIRKPSTAGASAPIIDLFPDVESLRAVRRLRREV